MKSIFTKSLFKMSSQIDFRTMPANVPVLCIPRVYPNISESRIRKIFDDLNMGTLERIDIVPKVSSANRYDDKGEKEKFNRVFVHFRRWNDTENANIARERLLNGKEVKIIYDDPWFWKISAYRDSERKPFVPSHRKPTLQFDSDDRNSKPERRRPDSRERRRPDSRERRRPDSRERRRPDSRERRRPDSRERRRPDSRERRRPDERPKKQQTNPSEEEHIDEGLKIDYGNPTIKNRKKAAAEIPKKPLKIEDEEEV